jgi:hypothetical protein
MIIVIVQDVLNSQDKTYEKNIQNDFEVRHYVC